MKKYLFIVLKGIGMGAADVIPGVSGGTVAFITGIYEELINSIKNIPFLLPLILKGKIKEFWNKANINFLLSVFIGIGISVISLAKLLSSLLENYPILVWSFFFGLIIASAIYIGKTIDKWNWQTITAAIIGAVIAYFITVISPSETSNSYLFIFISGAIAICAMILPGISGSFILLLLGKYAFIISSISNFKLDVIAVFGAGAVIGLLSFSNVLSWLLSKYKNITIAVLTGFMIGSLNKVWPWKKVIETYTNSHGEVKPLIEQSILPHSYNEFIGEPKLMYAIIMMVAGFSLIFLIEGIANKLQKK